VDSSASQHTRRLSGLIDFWYSRELPDVAESLAKYTERASSGVRRVVLKSGLFRALSILFFGKHHDYIAPNWYEWGRAVVVVNSLMPRPRPIVLFEVIDYGVMARQGGVGLLARLMARYGLGPALRRSVRLLQVMTEAERERFISLYGLDPAVVRCIPWPLLGWTGLPADLDRPAAVVGNYVFSSGRAACDWRNIFAAARGQPWKLVVVCSTSDLEQVRMLNVGVDAQLFTEISKSEHDRMLAHACVCAISLKEERKSSGQVRLGAAVELGVATVATAVDGLKDYLLPGVNAMTVPPADPMALRRAIEHLLADGSFREQLVATARQSCQGYTKADYFRRLRVAVESLEIARAAR
jgi:Glycosyl transferases group 1